MIVPLWHHSWLWFFHSDITVGYDCSTVTSQLFMIVLLWLHSYIVCSTATSHVVMIVPLWHHSYTVWSTVTSQVVMIIPLWHQCCTVWSTVTSQLVRIFSTVTSQLLMIVPVWHQGLHLPQKNYNVAIAIGWQSGQFQKFRLVWIIHTAKHVNIGPEFKKIPTFSLRLGKECSSGNLRILL